MEATFDTGPLVGLVKSTVDGDFPLPEEYRAGGSVPQRLAWPRDLEDLLSRRWHVYGFWADWVDYFYFKGDTEAFRPFLEEYAKLKDTPPKLILHPGQAKAKRVGQKEGTIPYDWQVTIDCRKPKPEVVVDLWTGGEVEVNKINVPANVKVESAIE